MLRVSTPSREHASSALTNVTGEEDVHPGSPMAPILTLMYSPGEHLRTLDTRTLLRRYAETLAILKERDVVRSRNAPVGDLAETLVKEAYKGHLAPPSQKSWDVELPDGTRLQVKSRVIDPEARGTQVYSPFRSWDFDRCVFVLFDANTYDVMRATEVPVTGVQSVARRAEWVAGDRVRVHADLTHLEGARDVTGILSKAMATLG